MFTPAAPAAAAAELTPLDGAAGEFPTLFFDPEDPSTLRLRPRRAAARDADRRLKQQQQQQQHPSLKQHKQGAPVSSSKAKEAPLQPPALPAEAAGGQAKQAQQKRRQLATQVGIKTEPQDPRSSSRAQATTRTAAAAAADADAAASKGPIITQPGTRKRNAPVKNAYPPTLKRTAARASARAADRAGDSDWASSSDDDSGSNGTDGSSDWAASDSDVSMSDEEASDVDAEYCPHSLDLLAAAAAAAGGGGGRGRGTGRAAKVPRLTPADAGGAVAASGDADAAGVPGDAAAVPGTTYRGKVRKSGVKGGRPPGAGNRTQMAPKSGSFGCRSARFTGVYKAQRVTVRWRTQFSYARKVGMKLLQQADTRKHSLHASATAVLSVPNVCLWFDGVRRSGIATAGISAAAKLGLKLVRTCLL
jgi:hypothetical protein